MARRVLTRAVARRVRGKTWRVVQVFCAISLLHDCLGFYSRCLTWRELAEELIHPYTAFQFAGTIWPIATELAKPLMRLSTWTLSVSLLEVLMAMRLFDEAKHVLNVLTVLVKTFHNAAYQLLNLIAAVVCVSSVVMIVYGQLFGMVDAETEAGTWGLARVIIMLMAPAQLKHSHMQQSPTGAGAGSATHTQLCAAALELLHAACCTLHAFRCAAALLLDAVLHPSDIRCGRPRALARAVVTAAAA